MTPICCWGMSFRQFASRHSVPGVRSQLLSALHVVVLWNFAVSQPVFDMLSRHPEFLVIRQSRPIEITALAVTLSFLLPAVGAGLSLLIGWRMPFVGRALQLMLLGGCSALLCLIAGRDNELVSSLSLVILAGLFGFLAVWGYHTSRSLRSFVTWLSPALLLFPALFLWFSPVHKILVERPEENLKTVRSGEQPLPPVVMVIFDELAVTALLDENLEIDKDKYPHFSDFVRGATWFRNTVTGSDTTAQAIPTIQNGKFPDVSLLPTPADHPNTIFSLLSPSHILKAFGTFTMLCPDDLCEKAPRESPVRRWRSLLSDLSIVYLHLLLPEAYRVELPSISENWMDFGKFGNTAIPPASELSQKDRSRVGLGIWASITKDTQINRLRQFEQFLEIIGTPSSPAFYFFHTLLPHVPYIYLPSGKTYTTDQPLVGLSDDDKERWGTDLWAAKQNYHRYLMQVKFVDTLLGRLVAHLRATGLYDASLIVVTSDHGVSFRRGEQRRQLSRTNAVDIAAVPFLIKAPYQVEPKVMDNPTATIDILPTVADLLGLEIDWPIDGESGFRQLSRERDFRFVSYKNRDVQLTVPAISREQLLDSVKFRNGLLGAGIPMPVQHQGRFDLLGVRQGDLVVREDPSFAIRQEFPTPDEMALDRKLFVPSLISGRLRARSWELSPHILAISVNGTIEAITKPWQFSVKGRSGVWSAVLPEDVVRELSPEIEIFLVSEEGNRNVLLRPTGHFDELPNYPEIGRSHIIAPSGTLESLDRSSYHGQIDLVRRQKGRLEIAGWAAKISSRTIPDYIWVYMNGAFLHEGPVGVSRPDVVATFGSPELLNSGFHYDLHLPIQLLMYDHQT